MSGDDLVIIREVARWLPQAVLAILLAGAGVYFAWLGGNLHAMRRQLKPPKLPRPPSVSEVAETAGA